MIRIVIYKDQENYKGIQLKGHSGYAEAGSDIVCAAVSTLTINTFNSIEKLTDDSFDEEIDEKRAYMKFMLHEPVSGKGDLLMSSLVLGLQSVADENNQYITLTFEEV